MPAGPVEEGSIIAHVKADLAQFDEAMDRADARVEKTSATKAEFKVDADVDEAIAKVAATEAALKKLGDGDVQASAKTVSARKAAQTAMERYEAAVQKVAAAEVRAEAASSRYNAADDANWRIQQRATSSLDEKRASMLKVDQAMARSTLANMALTAAESDQERAALKLAAANEALKASYLDDAAPPQVPPAGAASKGNGGIAYGAGIAIAVASLIPLLAPLAGYIAGVTGAFTLMGAAGVLAVFGIKNAMADGTAAGNQFSAGLHLLKGDFDQLSNTAADSMLSRFQIAISNLDAAMPSLNSDVRIFSGLLGDTGNIVLKTIISGFRIIVPLFIQAGVYVEQLAAAWQKWTTQGGLAAFVRMAVVGLPQVANALGSVLKGAVAVISGLAPLGTILLGVVQIVGVLLQGVGWLLNNGLTPLAVAAATAVGAFMGWRALVPIIANVAQAVANVIPKVTTFAAALLFEKTAATEAAVATDAVSVATKAALGPVGIIIALVGAVATGFLTAATSTSNATQAVQDYTSAVQEDNGVIGKNVELQTAKALRDEGAFQAAQKLGISLKTVTDAALGSTDAHQALVGALRKAQDAYDAAGGDAQRNAMNRTGIEVPAIQKAQGAYNNLQAAQEELAASESNLKAIKDAIKAYNDVQKALGGTTISTRQQLQAATDLAGRYGESLSVYEGAKLAQQNAADQLKQTTANMVAAIAAAGFLGQENSDAATSFSKIAIAAANATNAASQWKSELDVLNGGTQSLEQANINLAGDYQTMATQITSNIKSMGRAAATTLDINTAGGLANHQLILKNIQDAEAQSAAIIAAEGNTAKAREDGRQSLITARQAILDHAKAAGLDVDQVQALIDKELKIPAHVSTQVEVDISQAEAAIAKVQDKIAHIQDVKGVITYNTSTQALVGNAGGGTIGFANGGSIPGFAGGGGPSGTVFGPGSSTSDSVLARLSVGEEVTQASAANYPGVRSLLKMINRDPSGTMSALASQPKPQKTIVNHWHILQAIDPSSLYSEVQRRQNLVAQ